MVLLLCYVSVINFFVFGGLIYFFMLFFCYLMIEEEYDILLIKSNILLYFLDYIICINKKILKL